MGCWGSGYQIMNQAEPAAKDPCEVEPYPLCPGEVSAKYVPWTVFVDLAAIGASTDHVPSCFLNKSRFLRSSDPRICDVDICLTV